MQMRHPTLSLIDDSNLLIDRVIYSCASVYDGEPCVIVVCMDNNIDRIISSPSYICHREDKYLDKVIKARLSIDPTKKNQWISYLK